MSYDVFIKIKKKQQQQYQDKRHEKTYIIKMQSLFKSHEHTSSMQSLE